MQGIKRKILYVGTYEAVAIAVCSIAFKAWSSSSGTKASALAMVTSAVAVGWNFFFTYVFEAWEARQAKRARSILRRMAHAIGFETGLIVLLVPLIAWWLGVSLWQALLMDLMLAAYFLAYTFIFNWVFDRIFGLPASAAGP